MFVTFVILTGLSIAAFHGKGMGKKGNIKKAI
jgi:hypothetical protein